MADARALQALSAVVMIQLPSTTYIIIHRKPLTHGEVTMNQATEPVPTTGREGNSDVFRSALFVSPAAIITALTRGDGVNTSPLYNNGNVLWLNLSEKVYEAENVHRLFAGVSLDLA